MTLGTHLALLDGEDKGLQQRLYKKYVVWHDNTDAATLVNGSH